MATALLKLTDVQLGTSVTATNNFTIYQPASPDGTVRIGNGNSGSATDIMTLNSSGNVGIGTSSPGGKLDVKGRLTLSGVGTSELYTTDASGLYVTAATSAGMYIASDGTFYFRKATTPYTEYMRLDTSGNLGLGVTPNTTSVTTMQLPASFVIGSKGTGGSNYTYNAYYNGGWKYAATASSGMGAAVYFQNSTGHAWQVAGTGSADAAITFTQAMTLTATGNLGIGSTGPVSKLEVTNSGVASLIIGYNNTSYNYYDADTQIFRAGNSSTERMRIDSSGNLILGDTSANGKFKAVVADNASFQIAANFTNNTNADCNIRIKTSLADIGSSTATPLTFSNGNTERMRIDSSGNVGIGGVPLTSYRLTLTGDNSTSGVGIKMNDTGSSGKVYAIRSDAGSLVFGDATAGVTRMLINTDGRVLINKTSIGTTTDTKLSIAGHVSQPTGTGNTDGTSDPKNYGYGWLANATENTMCGLLTSNLQGNYGMDLYLWLRNSAGGVFNNRFQVLNAGSCYNTTGTYGTISDENVKENIVPAGGYLDKLNQVEVVKYSLKEENSDVPTKLGVVAQQVEQIFPGIVEQTNSSDENGDLIPTKAVKYSVFVPMLIKAVQELSAKVESLEAQLKGQA